MQKAMTILGIESSCDDTAASIVLLNFEKNKEDFKTKNKLSSGKILSSEIF